MTSRLLVEIDDQCVGYRPGSGQPLHRFLIAPCLGRVYALLLSLRAGNGRRVLHLCLCLGLGLFGAHPHGRVMSESKHAVIHHRFDLVIVVPKQDDRESILLSCYVPKDQREQNGGASQSAGRQQSYADASGGSAGQREGPC